NIDIKKGEFFSMLVPSGSGKTTVLRMIAGFEAPTTGQILLEGQDITDSAPFDREVNTVFQDYALFPHLSIAENVAYGLTVRKINKSDKKKLVEEALEQVQLADLRDRLPSQLSGGQRQRIALARALILRPKVLLLDEPLGALDKQLREQMQIELKQIQREAGITFIFVTHDQEEALTLSDRIAVYNDGKIEQVGSPREIYEFPQTNFVAKFLGVTNLLDEQTSKLLLGKAELHSVRPERISVSDKADEHDTIDLPATVAEVIYAGPQTRYLLEADNGLRLIAEKQNSHKPRLQPSIRRGDRVFASFDKEHASAVPNK
ncbi:MAG TPA: ABC transporter ATP-binding protein, partial [Microbacteriaceae bacterium]|nr:ABC transporter ATP-binding protein [Microbacteriaceae bacterium]